MLTTFKDFWIKTAETKFHSDLPISNVISYFYTLEIKLYTCIVVHKISIKHKQLATKPEANCRRKSEQSNTFRL